MSRQDVPLSGGTAADSGRVDISKETILEYEKRNTKMLVADDDESVRHLIQEILESEHIPVTVCAAGHEALDLIKREDFGMIVTDIMLKDFDGMGLLRAAKVINPETDVIIVTGYPSVETAVTAMRYGAAEYFTKPFGVDQLRGAVNRLVEKRILDRKLKVQRHQMEVQRFDGETGLFSNRYFHLLLSHELNRCARFKHPCGLLLAQVTGLKTLQESELVQARSNGDTLLKNLARLFRACCRQVDFIARYAYDEFAFILPETGQAGIEVVSSRVRQKLDLLNKDLAERGATLSLGVVFGSAGFPDSGNSKDLVLSKASQELRGSSA
ncbi:MAG: response regulator [Acidobacteriota bacterium]